MPEDEDVNIGLVVAVVPHPSFAGCANAILGTERKIKARKKKRIGDMDLIRLDFGLFQGLDLLLLAVIKIA